MKLIQSIGIGLFVIAIVLFSALPFMGGYHFDQALIKKHLNEAEYQNIGEEIYEVLGGKKSLDNPSVFFLSNKIVGIYNEKNESFKTNQEWDKVMWGNPNAIASNLMKEAAYGEIKDNQTKWFLLTFGLGILGALLFIIPKVVTNGPPGIKNNGIFHNPISSRGWLAWITMLWLVGFYIVLYFYPAYLTNNILIVSPISEALSGNSASQWFLYGFLYCIVMLVMGVRMYIKYRHSKYQIVRTTSVLFFQIAFAFLIPEILVRFNQPYFDFKNIWPLDYDFFFDWNLKSLIANGGLGIFMLVWGIALIVIGVPVFVYFFGKRWFCSWVCGCGGLAETLGDPYRQLSDKSTKAWKIERWLIHSVLVFAVFMTGLTLYTFFTKQWTVLGIETSNIQKTYGFLIGSVFAGVIGTGFYPVMGNRVWCRFGCPLAAYLGIIQRFKSRYRITTNGGQCISCGNCSTYCEQGIDVRSYAQRGEDIVRASCVGCGVCSAVCPRGVLNLENGPEETKKFDYPIEISKEGFSLLPPVVKKEEAKNND